MKKANIICRAIVLDKKTNKLLLVRNKGANFWYPPGGNWEINEKLDECTIREVKEETGIDIIVNRFLYLKQFSPELNKINLELFWLGFPVGVTKLKNHHIDKGGIVEESGWFSKNEIGVLKVFPDRIREQFWNDIQNLSMVPDLFIN